MNPSHYHCQSCSALFPKREAHFRTEYETGEFWGEVHTRAVQIDRCNACGSEEIDEVSPCVECHKALPAEGTDLCQPCLEHVETYWDRRVAEAKVSKVARLRAMQSFLAEIQREPLDACAGEGEV